MSDSLRDYVKTGSGEAFRRIVDDQMDAVYSHCLRQLRDHAAAEEVAQQVFITLAQKAKRIPSRVRLEGWLFKATRYCCSNYRRTASRRQSAERKAALMRNETTQLIGAVDSFCSRAQAFLDDAVASLAVRDRDAVLLRYFRGQSIREVGAAMGLSEDAAKKRLSRAVDRLRKYFVRCGMTAESAGVVALLDSAVKPAPSGAAVAASRIALTKRATGGFVAAKIHLLAKFAAGILLAASIAGVLVARGHGAEAQTGIPSPAAPAPVDAPPAPAQTQPAPLGDQTSPVHALSKLSMAIESHDQDAIAQCLCSDVEGSPSSRLALAWMAGEAANYRMIKASHDKFWADTSVNGFGFDAFATGTFDILLQGTLDHIGGPDVTVTGDVARVIVPLPPEAFAGTGPYRMVAAEHWSGATLVLNRVNGKWKLNTDRTLNFYIVLTRMDGNIADVVEVERQILQGVADSLNSVAADIEDGKITTRAEARKVIRNQMLRVFQKARVNGSNVDALPVIGG